MQTPAERDASRIARAHLSKQRDHQDDVAMGKLVIGYNAWRCPRCKMVHPRSRRSVGCGCGSLGKPPGV